MKHAKKSLPRSARRGFSIVEVLIVTAIIATLAAIAFPLAGKMIKSSKLEKNREITEVLEQAIDRFYNEYGYFPIKIDESEVLESDTNKFTTMLDELIGSKDNLKYNMKGINFLEAMPEAKRSHSGIVRLSDDIESLKNSFGGNFSIKFDSTYDEVLTAPGVLGGKDIKGKRSLIWCFGEDTSDFNDVITNWGFKP